MMKYDEAKPLYEESLAIRKELYGNNHRAVATAMNNLGLLLKNMELFKEAEEMMKASIAVREETYEDDHPAIAIGQNSLGLVLHASGELKEARKRFELALEIRKDALGEEHADVACSMYNLAEVLVSQSRLGQARKLFEDMIKMRINLFTSRHPVVMGSRFRFCELLRLMGLLEDYRNSNRKFNFDELLPEHKEFVISIQEAEEEDVIVSHYLKMDSNIGQTDAEVVSKETGYNEELEEAWSNDLRDRLGFAQKKLREELGKIESTVVRIKSTVEMTAAEMNNTEEDLEDNLIALQKLQDSPDASQETLMQIKRLEDFSAALKLSLAEKERAHNNAMEDLAALERAARLSRRRLEKEEDILRRLEAAESIEFNAREQVEKVIEELKVLQEKIDTIQSKINATGDDKDLCDQLAAAQKLKKSLEISREQAESHHRNTVKDLVSFKQRVSGTGGEVATSEPKPGVKQKIKRKPTAIEDEDDEELYDQEATDSENEDDGEGDAAETSALVIRLKKKVKKQRTLIKMLKNQISASGVAPIEDVITFEKAEEKLKSTLARLLMGDESASDEYDKWDHFVRNHPKYKEQEELKQDLWKKENEVINRAAVRVLRTIVPADIVSNCTLPLLETSLPKAVARRVWTKKALWLTRISTDHIAKLHVADLQTKYSCQGLDELELRAVWACLPERFENDPKGDKAQWRSGVLDALKAKREALPWSNAQTAVVASKMEIDRFLSSVVERNSAYK